MIDWRLCRFASLSGIEVHDLLRLRAEIFVVEQACPYADVDARDVEPGTRHLFGREDGRLIACARSLAPPVESSTALSAAPYGADRRDARIGRVAVATAHRRRGLASRMLERLLRDLDERLPDTGTRLDAQLPAETLYARFGFRRIGKPFLEDGIPHVPMRRPHGTAIPPQA